MVVRGGRKRTIILYSMQSVLSRAFLSKIVIFVEKYMFCDKKYMRDVIFDMTL